MDRERMEAFRKQLLDQREQLWVEIKHKHAEAAEMQDTGVPDPGDSSLTDDLKEFLDLLSDGKRERILEIDDALQRIENGSYGTCSRCGETIAERRLEVQPSTPYCLSCKQELEEEEAQRSGPEQGKI